MRAGVAIIGFFLLLAATASSSHAGTSLPMPAGGLMLNGLAVKNVVDMRFQRVVRQSFDLSCGAAAVATLLKYYYGETALDESEVIGSMVDVGDREEISEKGFSMLEMKRFVEARGYVSGGYKIENASDLDKLKIPVVTLIHTRGYSHFVVIKGVENGRVYVADPAFGNQSHDLASFAGQWSNVILTVLSPDRAGNNQFALDPSLHAPVSEVVMLLDRGLTAVRPGAGEF